MTWTVHQIHARLVELDESDHIEAKTGLGDAAMKSISAFSNEVGMRGGWIVFGVRRRPHGTYETPGVRADLVDGKRVVVAFVAEATPGDKPVYIKKQGAPQGGLPPHRVRGLRAGRGPSCS